MLKASEGEREKNLVRINDNEKKYFGRQKMAINVAIKNLNVVGGRKSKHRKRVPQRRKEAFRIEVVDTL